jgi:hypothetical protein
VIVVIAIVVMIAHVATLPDFFQFVAPLLGLAASLAVPVDGFLQILFRPPDIAAAPVIPVGARRRRHSGH